MSSLTLPIFTIALFALLFITLTFFQDAWPLHVHARDLVNEIPRLSSVSHHNSLDTEVQERRKELLIYTASGKKFEAMWKKSSHVLSLRSEWVAKIMESIISFASITDAIGCDQLRYIKNVDFLGAGYTKTVVKGVLPKGFPVALKSVNEKGSDMQRCLEDFKDLEGCRELVSYKLIKEILLLQHLRHPNIIEVGKTLLL